MAQEDLIQERRKKLDGIRALGQDPYGWRFENVTPNARAREIGDRSNITPGEIQEGAKLVSSAQDILEELNLTAVAQHQAAREVLP